MSNAAGLTGLKARAWSRLGLSSDPRRPSRALFAGIRRRLILWYSGILAGLLVLSGVILYFAVQEQLLGPVNSTLQAQAQLAARYWQLGAANNVGPGLAPTSYACPHNPEVDHGLEPNLFVACYDTHGKVLGAWALGVSFGQNLNPFKPFLNSSLARSVVSETSATDTVDTKLTDEYAAIQRYALVVSNPPGFGKGDLGVIQVGLPVGGQGQALSTLFDLLLLLGALTVLFSVAAGLFLASRALQPARIAYARQRDFIADASHELRTPLTMLRSTVEFVLRGKDHLPPDDVALLEDTVAETTHLTQLANNMLDLARLDSETFHIEEEVVDLSDVAQEVGRWARALARERGVTLSVQTADPALVLGDGSLLEQCVLVLVDNAIKYNHPGGSVDIRVSRSGTDGVIEVKDTGIGVSPEHLKRLGERFYRVDKARSRESGGAGLGLSIVRSVIARHNGTFHLDSAPGVGTTASIRLNVISERDIRFEDEMPEEAEPVPASQTP